MHNKLGFGFLESVYQNSLMIELIKAGLKAQLQSPIKVFYEDRIVGDFIADIIVEDKVILELKSVKELHPATSPMSLMLLLALCSSLFAI